MKSLNPEMTQLLYEVLTNSSARDYSGYEHSRPLSVRHKVDGDIVFFVEDLLDKAESRLSQERAEVLADVVDRGIVSWCLALEPSERTRLGLEGLFELDEMDCFGEDSGVPGEKKQPLATGEELQEKRQQQLQAIENLERIRKRLVRQLDEERAKTVRLEKDIAEMKDKVARAEDDAQPADLPAYDAEFSPYTQLTAHVFAPQTMETPVGTHHLRKENSRRHDSSARGSGAGRSRRS